MNDDHGHRPLLVYAHRGARSEEPENTLRAFRRAEAAGADGVELDVRVSQDGHLVVIHDAVVDRTTDGTGKVADLSLRELQELDAGAGTRIPTLLQAVRAYPGPLQVEIKAPEAVAALADLDRRGDLPTRRTVLTSFTPAVLEHAARLLPHVERGLITHHPGEDLLEVVTDLKATWLCPELTPELTRRLVSRFQSAGVRVDAWPASGADRLARCVELGADAVTTDFPARIDDWLGAG